jgi:hypothetical protein
LAGGRVGVAEAVGVAVAVAVAVAVGAAVGVAAGVVGVATGVAGWSARAGSPGWWTAPLAGAPAKLANAIAPPASSRMILAGMCAKGLFGSKGCLLSGAPGALGFRPWARVSHPGKG